MISVIMTVPYYGSTIHSVTCTIYSGLFWLVLFGRQNNSAATGPICFCRIGEVTWARHHGTVLMNVAQLSVPWASNYTATRSQ